MAEVAARTRLAAAALMDEGEESAPARAAAGPNPPTCSTQAGVRPPTYTCDCIVRLRCKCKMQRSTGAVRWG